MVDKSLHIWNIFDLKEGYGIDKYVSTALPDSVSISGIVTVFRLSLDHVHTAKGEAHNFPEIFYLESGNWTVSLDGKDFPLSAGQMLIYAPFAFHVGKGGSFAKASILSFEGYSDRLHLLYNRIITLTAEQKKLFSSIVSMGENCFRLRRGEETFVQGMLPTDDTDAYKLGRLKKQLEFFLTDILAGEDDASLRATPTEMKWDREFTAAITFLEAHLSEPLTQEEIAEGCSMSVSKLKLLFRKKCGKGPINRLVELRIERAKQLIREGALNFTEIADAVGFNSIHYFSRTFKRLTGITPSEFAKTVCL